MKSRLIDLGNGADTRVGSLPRNGDDPHERDPDRQAVASRVTAIPTAAT